MPGETLVIKARWFLAAVLVVACGGTSTPASVSPTGSAKGAVDGFMQAVADSNLTAMANLWGTAAGPAAKTNIPADWERRISVMQSYLQNESHRIVSDSPEGSADRHALQVEIRRQLCSWVVPFTAIKLADGTWIISQVDLTKAGNPARPCVPGGGEDTTSQQ
jgi:hypothetical protein